MEWRKKKSKKNVNLLMIYCTNFCYFSALCEAPSGFKPSVYLKNKIENDKVDWFTICKYMNLRLGPVIFSHL